jgi:hypothetical protein
MRLGGWRSIRMVMRYAHVNVDGFADTIDRLRSPASSLRALPGHAEPVQNGVGHAGAAGSRKRECVDKR